MTVIGTKGHFLTKSQKNCCCLVYFVLVQPLLPQIFVVSQEGQGFYSWKKKGKKLHTKKGNMLSFGCVNSPHEHLYGSAVSVERVIKLGRALGCFDKSKLVGREMESSHCSILLFKYQLSFLQP